MFTILADAFSTAVYGARHKSDWPHTDWRFKSRTELENEMHRNPYAEFRNWPR